MDFDPDAYLKEKETFNPDAYLADKQPPAGVPINPKVDTTPLPQPLRGMDRFKQNMLAGPRALETAARLGLGTVGSLAGGAMGGIEWLGDRIPGSKPTGATPSSGAEAGAQFANRMIDKAIGPASERTQDYMKAIANSKELEAVGAMVPPEAAMLSAARLGEFKTPSLPSVPSRVRDVVNQARGNVANEAAEGLRSKMVAQSDRMATQARQAQQTATEQATRAGLDADHAAAWGQAAQRNLENSEKLGAAIDQKLLERPNMSKEEFGGMLRAAAKTLHETKAAERMNASGYAQALEQDANATVDTGSINRVIAENEKGISNPGLRSTLESIKTEIAQGSLKPQKPPGWSSVYGLPPPSKTGLPLQNADSLRKYLDGIIETKQVKVNGGSMAVDKESLSVVKDIRRSLTESMDASSPALKEARKKWADLSRGELDRLEGKGDIAKTISSDSLSGEYKLTEAEVAGAIIRRANAGSDSLSMLAKTQPGLKEAGRLYFTGELFGKGAVPTPSALASFVKTNERSLKQLGLYDEFKDVASAQRARQTALEGAREDVKASGQAQSAAERLQSGAQRTADQKQRLGDKYSTFQTEMQNVPGKELPGRIKSFGKDMVNEGLISQDEYGQMIRDADALSLQYDNAAAKKALLLKIGAYLGLGAAGTYGAKHALGI